MYLISYFRFEYTKDNYSSSEFSRFSMYPKVDIIYFTLFPWDHSYSSVSLSFSREFAKNNRVFYVNHPFTYKDFLYNYNADIVQKRKQNLWLRKTTFDPELVIKHNFIPIHPPNTIPTNFLPKGKLYQALKKWNDKVVLKSIEQVIKKYRLEDFIFLNCFNPFYLGGLPAGFGQKLNIYQCIDDMTQEAYTAKHAYHLEKETVKKADIVFVTSKNLHRLKAPLNPNTHILHNAVDWNIFRESNEKTHEKPFEIRNIKTKIIGFTGNLNEYRVNYRLLREIAVKNKDKTLVLVGPLNSNDYQKNGLDQLPNVILTGGKNITELPQYLQHFDCLIIPFLCNKLTSSVYPLKINEYLTSGKPIVSTNFSEDISSFEQYIYLAKNESEFLHLIDDALLENDPEMQVKRIESSKKKYLGSTSWTILGNCPTTFITKLNNPTLKIR